MLVGITSLTNAHLNKGTTHETFRAKCFLFQHVGKVLVSRKRRKSQCCGGQLGADLMHPYPPCSKAESRQPNSFGPPHRYPGSPGATCTDAQGKCLGREPEKNLLCNTIHLLLYTSSPGKCLSLTEICGKRYYKKRYPKPSEWRKAILTR